MTPENLAYWLQGFLELTPRDNNGNYLPLSSKQVQMMAAHVEMCFAHSIDPSLGDEKHREELQKIHDDIDKMNKKADARPVGSLMRPSNLRFDRRLMC